MNCKSCPHWERRNFVTGKCQLSTSDKGEPRSNSTMWGVSRNGRGEAYAITNSGFLCNQHPQFKSLERKGTMSRLVRWFTSLFSPQMICMLALSLSCSAWAQDGPNVNQSDGPPTRAFTSLFFYDGSNRLEYQCIAEASGNRSELTITGATNATPIEITVSENHGLQTGSLVTISQIQGNTAANGTWVIVSTGATTFTLRNRTTAASVAGNGAYVANSGVASTNAPRTNQPHWAILKLAYDGSGNLQSKKWIEGSTGTRSGAKICDNRANYGSQ